MFANVLEGLKDALKAYFWWRWEEAVRRPPGIEHGVLWRRRNGLVLTLTGEGRKDENKKREINSFHGFSGLVCCWSPKSPDFGLQ